MRQRTIQFAWLLFATGLQLGLLPACTKERKVSATPGRGPSAVAVVAGVAQSRDVADDLRAVGSVQPRRSVAVRARVSGQLQRVAFTEGDEVREGQVLFLLDAREFQAALDAAEANLARDAARSSSAEADARRYAELVAKDFVTRQEAENLRAAAAAAAATLRGDSAAVVNARLNVEYTTIRAPLSGRTGSLSMHEGNLVKANDEAPLIVINQVVPIEVVFSVPERNLPEIRRRMADAKLEVVASFPSDTTGSYSGELTFLDNEVDPATGTVRMKATFANEDRALWPGQFVSVALRLGTQLGAVVVPSTAIQTGQKGTFLYVILPDQTAELRNVVAGREVDGHTVIEEGLAVGEQVVTDGQLRVTPGAKVSIKPPAGSGAAAATKS